MLLVATFLVNAAFNFALGVLVARFLGPEGFGQYAIAAAAAVILNTLMLDWIRVAATRFYSERTRERDPSVRATLDALFVLSSVGVVLVCAIGLAAGASFGLSATLAAFAPAMAICNGLFDYHTALARARFADRLYSLIVILKNVLALALMVGGAWWFRSAEMVAAGFALSLIAAMLIARSRLRDPGVRLLAPDWRAAGCYFAYGFPVILAFAIYFAIPFVNRAAIAGGLGFAASGQYSLAYDLGIRVVQTVGSAIDILLLQLAIRARDEQGPAAAEAQLSRNMGVVLAAAAATAGGYWLVLPSFEAALVPAEFRGSFAALTTALLPGLFLFALLQAGVTPVFQIGRSTWRAPIAAAAALLAAGALAGMIGPGGPAVAYAWAQSAAYAVALAVAAGLAFRVMPARPRLRDVVWAGLAALAMAAVVWPLRASWEPGWVTLLASAAAGGAAFLAVCWLGDVGGCRALVRRGGRPSGTDRLDPPAASPPP